MNTYNQAKKAQAEFKKLWDEMGLEAVFDGGRDEASLKAGDEKIAAFAERVSQSGLLGKLQKIQEAATP